MLRNPARIVVFTGASLLAGLAPASWLLIGLQALQAAHAQHQ